MRQKLIAWGRTEVGEPLSRLGEKPKRNRGRRFEDTAGDPALVSVPSAQRSAARTRSGDKRGYRSIVSARMASDLPTEVEVGIATPFYVVLLRLYESP